MRGARVSKFFTKNPNLKKKKIKNFFFRGRGGDEGRGLEFVIFFLLRIQI